jgi:predicted AAA+ superfamily ATPase
MVTYPRILAAPAGSFLLFGPRGTGKSTWVRSALPDAYRVDLLDEARFQAYLAAPGTLGDELRRLPAARPVVIDEVQRLPWILNEVHRAIEDRGQRFALLGSSARKLKTLGTNLLAGRAVRREMHPLVPEELGADFQLDAVLAHGSVPVVWSAPDRADALRAYVRMYLREEIQTEALVRNLPGFARFLPIAGVMHGQTLNVSGIARDAGVSRTTVVGYLDVLEDTLIAFRLPAIEAKMRVRERHHPKLYLFDPGVARALKGPVGGPPVPEEIGALFEGWIAGLLRAYADPRELFDAWGYWAPADSTTEVDFVLRRGAEHLAIEVKAARAVPTDAFRGLRAIEGLPGLVRRVVVCREERPRRTLDGIDVLPAAVFASELASGTLWP